MTETAKEMIERYGYPHTYLSDAEEYEDVMAVYEQKLREGKEKGFTPVIVSVDDTLEEYWGILADGGYSAAEAIQKAVSINGKEYLDRIYAGYLEESGQNEEDLVGDYDYEPQINGRFYAFMDFETFCANETIIFEVPTSNPWEVVAYLPFGGWNDCPNPEDMVAICKYWFEKYGAVPVTITHDIMEMSVPEPVGASNATELAKEHFAFTPDRVFQGTETCTISEVAASLSESKIWFFWWD